MTKEIVLVPQIVLKHNIKCYLHHGERGYKSLCCNCNILLYSLLYDRLTTVLYSDFHRNTLNHCARHQMKHYVCM